LTSSLASISWGCSSLSIILAWMAQMVFLVLVSFVLSSFTSGLASVGRGTISWLWPQQIKIGDSSSSEMTLLFMVGCLKVMQQYSIYTVLIGQNKRCMNSIFFVIYPKVKCNPKAKVLCGICSLELIL
jgi:hypothetical protein